MQSAAEWKSYYDNERRSIDIPGLIEKARPLDLDGLAAIVIPHTRLEYTGHQIACAVQTVLASGAERVLAIGVLHGARRQDADLVARARVGDPTALDALRGVHTTDTLAAEEFSLDGFRALLDEASARAGRAIELVERYPFFVGDDPATLPGLEELQRLAADALIVATTDPIHHGHAYGTRDRLDPAHSATIDLASAAVAAQYEALSGHRFGEFQQLTAQHRSDFRDSGPVIAELVGAGWHADTVELQLVPYDDVLGGPAPSWVAGALTACYR